MTSEKNWYVLRSHPRHEEALYEHILSLGYECFFPHLKVEPVNPRAKKARPYFPGYLFVRYDLEADGDGLFNWMQGSKGLVSFGGQPAVVPDGIVNTIHLHLERINARKMAADQQLHKGEEVEIQTGAFAGFSGIFDVRLSGSERVRILLKMLNQERVVPIVLPEEQIISKNNKDKRVNP